MRGVFPRQTGKGKRPTTSAVLPPFSPAGKRRSIWVVLISDLRLGFLQEQETGSTITHYVEYLQSIY